MLIGRFVLVFEKCLASLVGCLQCFFQIASARAYEGVFHGLQATGQVYQRACQDPFRTNIYSVPAVWTPVVIGFGPVLKNTLILGFVVGPLQEGGLLRLLLIIDMIFYQLFGLAVIKLPVIGDIGIVGG